MSSKTTKEKKAALKGVASANGVHMSDTLDNVAKIMKANEEKK